MATGKTSLEIRNKGLLIFGITLLLIGLVTSLYYYDPYGLETRRVYPYQSIGIILVVAGIVFAALGFFYPSQRTLPPPPQKT